METNPNCSPEAVSEDTLERNRSVVDSKTRNGKRQTLPYPSIPDDFITLLVVEGQRYVAGCVSLDVHCADRACGPPTRPLPCQDAHAPAFHIAPCSISSATISGFSA